MGSFSIWLGIGASLGLWRLAVKSSRQHEDWLNAGLAMLAAALGGARAGYVTVNWSYFSTHLIEAPQLWLGGFTWAGALLGAWVGMIFLSILMRPALTRRISLGWTADHLYPLLPPIAVTAWLGAWQTGAGYGRPVLAGAWWGLPTADESGALVARFPTQFLAALCLLVFFFALERWVKPYRPPGRLSGLAMLGLLVHLLAFSLLCADPAPYWNGLRNDTWAAILALVIFFSYVLFQFLAGRIEQIFRRIPALSRTRSFPFS